MTRRFSGSSPRIGAIASRIALGFWLDAQAVSLSPSPGTATMPLFSMGTPASRWLTMRTSATWSAPASGSPSSRPTPVSKQRFDPASSNKQRRAILESCLGIHDCRQEIEVEPHALGGVGRCGPRLGHNDSEDVADQTHLVGRKEWASESRRKHGHSELGLYLHVGSRVHRDNAGHVASVAHIDGLDRGVSHRGANEVHVTEPVDIEVVEVLVRASEERWILSPEYGVAENRALDCGHCAVPLRCGGVRGVLQLSSVAERAVARRRTVRSP